MAPWLIAAGVLLNGLVVAPAALAQTDADSQSDANVQLDAETGSANQGAGARADAAYDGGEYELAEHLYLKAIAALGDVHDSAYVDLQTRLGNCYYMAGKFEQAAIVFRRAIQADEDLHGTDSLQVANDLFNLTRSLRRQYRWSDAEPVIQRTLKIRRKVLGDNDLLVAMSWADLAVNLQREGRFDDSESAFKKTIAIRERLNDGGRARAVAYHLYARLLKEMNRPAEASVYDQRAKELGIGIY